MKTVFESSMVAHIWANQSQEHAKSSHGNLYFNGREIFSYGSHYLVGIIMPDGTALLNADKNSVTTNKHCREAWHAASHRIRYELPGLTRLASEVLRYTGEEHSTLGNMPKRVRDYLLNNAAQVTPDAGAYLLKLVKVRNPEKTFATIASNAKRAAEKKKLEAETSTRRNNLEYAAKVSKLAKDEKALVQGLANVIAGPDHKIAGEAKKLHLAHRAAKAAKRDRQAADVWRVLKLVKAEIALREKQQARKNANNYLKTYGLTRFRDGIKELKKSAANNDCVGSYAVQQLAEGARVISQSSRVPFNLKRGLVSFYEALNDTREEIVALEAVKHEREQQEKLAAWYRGEGRASFYGASETMLRAIDVERDETGKITGGNLETSRGAEVPLTHAIRAFRFIKLCRDNHAQSVADSEAAGHFPIDVIAWSRNGHSVRVGHFAIDTIWASGNFRAGCHSVTWNAVERLARELGVFTETASDDALEPSHAAA